jgi:hypothetical protein
MFGYACRQTPELMRLPIMLAHRLAMRLADVRKQKVLPFLGPDGKSQVTVEYRDGKPVRVDYLVLACQHTPDVVTADGNFMTEEAKRQVVDAVARPVLGELVDEKTTFTVNCAGKFLVGGPQARPPPRLPTRGPGYQNTNSKVGTAATMIGPGMRCAHRSPTRPRTSTGSTSRWPGNEITDCAAELVDWLGTSWLKVASFLRRRRLGSG